MCYNLFDSWDWDNFWIGKDYFRPELRKPTSNYIVLAVPFWSLQNLVGKNVHNSWQLIYLSNSCFLWIYELWRHVIWNLWYFCTFHNLLLPELSSTFIAPSVRWAELLDAAWNKREKKSKICYYSKKKGNLLRLRHLKLKSC